MRTLGIDLGTNSIGWCLIETNGEPGLDTSVGAIVAIGTRIFSQSEFAGRDPQSKTSLAVARREARAMRRQRDRYLSRRSALLRTLIQYGLMPGDEAAQKQLLRDTGDAKGGDVTRDVYALRSRALTDRLEPFHIGRILFQLDQRRGFKSNRKTDRADNEAGKIATGVARLDQAIMAAGARTYGEFLHKRRLRGQSVRTRLRPETGEDAKGDGYDFYPSRAALETEFDKITAAQARFHPTLLIAERVKHLRDIIFYQRPLKPAVPGKCSYNPKEERLPKAHPLFQAFRLYKEINELALIGEDQTTHKLTPQQRDVLVRELRQKKSVTYAALRKRLKLDAQWRFNKESDNRPAMTGDEVSATLGASACFGLHWSRMSATEQWRAVALLRDMEDPRALQQTLIGEFGLTEEQAKAAGAVKLPEGYGRMGQTALKSLLDALIAETDENGRVITEAEASIRVYGKTNSEDDLNKPALDELPPYQEVLERHIPPGTGNPDDIYDVFKGRITNPTVHIGLNQLRRVVNAIIKAHGKPDRIAVELGRDLKLSDKQREEINREIGKNTRAAEQRSQKLRELGQDDTGYNRLRLKLWEELNPDPHNRVCIYTGRPITIGMVFTSAVDVDHILPYSKTLDDSQGNKLLCLAEGNRQKHNRAPADVTEWTAHYEEILARANALPKEKRWRFAENAMEKYSGDRDFLARQLTDMQYVGRMALTYLASLYPNEEADRDGVLRRHSRVRALPGKMTEMLRRLWNLNELLPDHNFADAVKQKNRLDHRHHAIDAAVIACTSRALIQRISGAAARGEQEMAERMIVDLPPPWQSFREELRVAVNSVVVSHKPDHGTISRAGYKAGKGQTAGRLHNDTAYGPTTETTAKGDPLVVHRVSLTSLASSADLDLIRDKTLRETLRKYTAGLSHKEFAAALVAFSRAERLDGASNPFKGLRHVRILEPLKTIPIKDRNGRAYKGYKGDANHRYDVWQLKNEKWKAEIVSSFDAHDPNWTSRIRAENPMAKKVLSLQQNDVVAVGQGSSRQLLRVVKFSAGSIVLAGLHEAGSLKGRDADTADPFKYQSKSASSLKAERARQVRLDELGRVWDPQQRS